MAWRRRPSQGATGEGPGSSATWPLARCALAPAFRRQAAVEIVEIGSIEQIDDVVVVVDDRQAGHDADQDKGGEDEE